MGIKVVLTNKSQQTRELTNNSTILGNDIHMSRFVYQYFRSLAKGKTISYDYQNRLIPKEMVSVLDKLSDLHEGIEVEDNIHKLDEYLGSLGVDEEYFFSKDVIQIEDWSKYIDQNPTRNVLDDLNSIEQNVIANIDGTDYNVSYET